MKTAKPTKTVPVSPGPDPLDPDFAPESRAASLWPESTRPADLPSTQFGVTRFDPLAEERERERAQLAAAFDVCHPALALRVVVLLQVAALTLALLAAPVGEVVSTVAGTAFAALAGALLWLVIVCALKAPLSAASPALRATAVLVLGAMASLAGTSPLWWAGIFEVPGPARALGLVLAGALPAALAWAWLDLRARLWRPAEARARLAELQSRIRPHFLFNALNTALALVRVDPDRAERVLEDLSALFREALADAGTSVSLDDEMDLAQRYLAIEQIRFGNRLMVSWDIDPKVGRARVPALVLQPLVENAVRHGIEPAVKGGQVWIQAGVRRGQAVVLVSNTLSDEPSRPGSGMALANVRERLRLLHDVGAQCDAWREGDRFHARLVVPL